MTREVRARYREEFGNWSVEVRILTRANPKAGISKESDNWVSMAWFETESEAQQEKERMENYYEDQELLM